MHWAARSALIRRVDAVRESVSLLDRMPCTRSASTDRIIPYSVAQRTPPKWGGHFLPALISRRRGTSDLAIPQPAHDRFAPIEDAPTKYGSRRASSRLLPSHDRALGTAQLGGELCPGKVVFYDHNRRPLSAYGGTMEG